MQRTCVTLVLVIGCGLLAAPSTGEPFWREILTSLLPRQSPEQAAASTPVTFTHGIASGDVRPFSAVLWTRVDREVDLLVDVSTDDTFPPFKTLKRQVAATADNDFTAKVTMAPLLPNQIYYYRWRYGASVSEVGTFKTPPWRFASTDVRFAFSGDSDGTRVGDRRCYNNFEVLNQASAEGLDFFVYLGDTVVSDSLCRASPATTMDEYRNVYKENRELENLLTLLRNTSVYAIWDDHEVFDNYAGQTVDPERYAYGREAFLEYMPVRPGLVSDSICPGDPLFRIFHWGKGVDIIILDERSCRSPSDNVVSICEGDLAPTLPPEVRDQLRTEFSLLLPTNPPDGCLEAIFDPARTMLGHRQKALFEAALLFSTAKFKFVINEVPMQQFYALPYDRWEGYGFERAEILGFIRLFGIDNVVFLSADFHGNLINEVFIDRFLAPEPVAVEVVTGPIADVTVEVGLAPDLLDAFKLFLKDEEGLDVDCVRLDAFSYGLVDVNASTGTATITLKDDSGEVLRDQVDPSRVCTKVIGP